jgi:hypothetical protein
MTANQKALDIIKTLLQHGSWYISAIERDGGSNVNFEELYEQATSLFTDKELKEMDIGAPMSYNAKKDRLIAHIDGILRRRVFVRTAKDETTYIYTSTVKVVYGEKEIAITGEQNNVNCEISIQDQINQLIKRVIAKHDKEIHEAIMA